MNYKNIIINYLQDTINQDWGDMLEDYSLEHVQALRYAYDDSYKIFCEMFENQRKYQNGNEEKSTDLYTTKMLLRHFEVYGTEIFPIVNDMNLLYNKHMHKQLKSIKHELERLVNSKGE